MKAFAIGLFTAVLLSFLACSNNSKENGGSGGVMKLKSTGKMGELVIVMPESWWNDTAGAAFRYYFGNEYPGLPQRETAFTLVHINPKEYNRLFKTHRNLILVEDDSAAIAFEYNRFAKGQLVMAIEAPDPMSFANLMRREGKSAAKEFMNAEIERLEKAHKGVRTVEAVNELAALGIQMTVPNDFRLNTVEDDFIWFFRDKRDITQGVVVYISDQLPDVGMEEAVIAARDSATTRVEGGAEGSYMSVEKLYTPMVETTQIQGRFAMKTRGLWKMENDFMGGSFVNLTIWDEAKNRTVSVDGFVYAPGKDKRNFMMELEAIVQSIQFISSKKP